MEMNKEITLTSCDYGFADIYIAGPRHLASEICMKYCLSGFCVNISDCEYIYTGGSELGVKIGIINYARYPESQTRLTDKALELGGLLIEGMYQSSATVITPERSYFLSRR